MSRRLKPYIFSFFVFTLLILSPAGYTAQLPVPEPPALVSVIDSAAIEEEFLPIDAAYQLTGELSADGQLAITWFIAPGYYLYQERFSATLLAPPTEFAKLDLRFQPGTTRYDDYYEKDMVVYYNQTTVFATLPSQFVDRDLLQLKIQSQACADAGLCYPPRTQFLTIDRATGKYDVADQTPGTGEETDTAAIQSNIGLAAAILFAFIGGVILNLMPCVFPVLSVKVLSLTSSHLTSNKRHIHGLVYSAGVITTFIAVAIALILLRQGGQALGWGFQLQSPGFITALVFLFFVMGLSFSGFFQPGANLMNIGQSASSGADLRHSFLTGVLATLVASPCSAPFMGTALGFALTQPPVASLVIFSALGAGMAMPFLLLTWSPSFLGKLPKPGRWMDILKELLAFPLYFTCLWLLWILGNQTSGNTVIAVMFALVILAFAIWLSSKGGRITKMVAGVVAIWAFILPLNFIGSPGEEPAWRPYSKATLDTLLAEDRAVFVNLTADWCITCLANEKIALSSEEFYRTLKDQDITYLKGDWTNYDPEITELLNRNGRNGVPLYLFYREGTTRPEILPQILSRSAVINRLQNK